MSHPYDRPLFIRWHLGLGDAILCNGLVRSIASVFMKVIVTAKPHNLESVRFMFSDNPSISVHEADDQQSDFIAKNFDGTVLPIGSFAYFWEPEHWDTCFYKQAGVPVDERWKSFQVPEWKGENLFYSPYEYSFIHSTSSDGSFFDTNETIRETKAPVSFDVSMSGTVVPITAWCKTIRGASEIYCIDCAFSCLVDCMPDLKATKFVLYHKPKSVAPYGPPTLLKKPWEHRYL